MQGNIGVRLSEDKHVSEHIFIVYTELNEDYFRKKKTQLRQKSHRKSQITLNEQI